MNGLGEFDFSALFDKVATAAGNIYQTKAQIDAQKQAYKLEQQRIANQAYSPTFDFNDPNSPVYAPNYLPQSQFPIMPVLLIGGLGLAAFLLLRK
jgi:hypothetical protein